VILSTLSRYRKLLLSFAGIALVFGLWEAEAYWLAATYKYGSDLLPTIQHVFSISLPQMARFGSENAKDSFLSGIVVLLDHSRYTVLRLVVGTALGAFIGIGLGLAISINRPIRLVLEPPILLVRNIPLLALIPLFSLWFGAQEVGKIAYVAFAIAVMLVINTVQAVANVRAIYVNYARTLGASAPALYRTVIIPSILPELLAGLKVALGVSWAIVLAAEFLMANEGLGKLLILAQTFFDVGRMLVIVLVFVVYSLILNAVFDRITRVACKWLPATK